MTKDLLPEFRRYYAAAMAWDRWAQQKGIDHTDSVWLAAPPFWVSCVLNGHIVQLYLEPLAQLQNAVRH